MDELTSGSPTGTASFDRLSRRTYRRDHQAAPPPEVLAEFRRLETERDERQARYGRGREIVHGDLQEHKFVAVGAKLFYSKRWRTFTDFLMHYIKDLLINAYGAEWGQAELAKPFDRRHPILQWYDALCAFQAAHKPGPDGISEGAPDGPTMAYLSLAYDLYLLAHHQKLLDSVIARLRHQDQFQGARYELAVAATMIRAGFDLEHEDERDNQRKHPEFLATNPSTGEIVAVEAKSRHRPGVLGRTGERVDRTQFRIGIESLFRKALAKQTGHPYVIFIDANMPADVAWEDKEKWIAEVQEMLPRVAHPYNESGIVTGVPFTALVITNFPHHYGLRALPDPGKLAYISAPVPARYPFRSPRTLDGIETALRQYGHIPSVFPT